MEKYSGVPAGLQAKMFHKGDREWTIEVTGFTDEEWDIAQRATQEQEEDTDTGGMAAFDDQIEPQIRTALKVRPNDLAAYEGSVAGGIIRLDTDPSQRKLFVRNV